MRRKYNEFVVLLPPLKEGAGFAGPGSVQPEGWGWATGDGKRAFEMEGVVSTADSAKDVN